MSKKRGRKRKDSMDHSIELNRLEIPRGVNFLRAVLDDTDTLVHDNLVQLVLAQELDLVKDGQLLEFRETECLGIDESESIAGGSPVSVRMKYPPLSVYKCLRSAFDQILYSQVPNDKTAMHAFTHESHILLSKACELITIESVSRAYLHMVDRGTLSSLDDGHLRYAMRGAWKSHGKNIAGHMSFDFLEDVLDSANHNDRPIDLLSDMYSSH